MADKGLLLMNLGSPNAPTRAAVKEYLNEFLTDGYVIDLPGPVRQLLVRGIITPFRAEKSAAAYRKVWREEGSPLVHYTREFAAAVAAEMGPEWDVRWAMRYGEPTVESQLRGWNVRELTIVPLYPQYAESSTRTAFDRVRKAIREVDFSGPVNILQDFFDQPEFIECQAARITEARRDFDAEHLLLSFHGLPEHHMTKLHADHCFTPGCCDYITNKNRLCYRAQCFATARLVTGKMGYPKDRFSVAFQSRLGRRPWIKPYTDHVVTELARKGIKRLLVACPSFVADCLETLEEIEMRLSEQFIADGGQELRLVPSLNADPLWVKNFGRMIQRPDLAWQRQR